MKKTIAVLTLSSLLFLTGCSSQDTSKEVKDTKTAVTFEKETKEYKNFVEQQIDKLLADTQKWVETIKSGDIAKVKAEYPLIRMAYERSEPIAESFSELDVKIDFRLADFKEEFKTEEGWAGYHKIEQILWEKNTLDGVQNYAEQLVNDIKELKAKILTVDVTPELMLTGSVDLLNEVATQKITGEEEVYSHTDLYDFRANIQGAEKIFEIFTPAIKEKDPKLVETLKKEFKTVNGLLDSYMTDKENYKLYTDLSKEDTKKLAEAVTKLGEPLSQMGIIVGAKK